MAKVCAVFAALLAVDFAAAQLDAEALAGLATLFGGMNGGSNTDCTYSCKDGTTPKNPNATYKPSFNGCGTAAFPMQAEGEKYGLTVCCNEHDLCYDTCNQAPFSTCESNFEKCLKKQCRELAKQGNNSEAEGCRSTAAMFTAATRMGGCQFYKESQRAACDCSEQGGPGAVRAERKPRTKKGGKRGKTPKKGKKGGKLNKSGAKDSHSKSEL